VPNRPLFSIGITTYNRPDMLRECVASVLRQTEDDFEVLIGNDYQAGPVTRQNLGIDDARVRIINHPLNLGELRNLNALLEAASGRYFTWQADDDFYAPTYLASMRRAFDRFPDADAAFCSFSVVNDPSIPRHEATLPDVEPEGMAGAEFLRRCWRGILQTMAFTGMYNRERLRSRGGLVSLSDAPVAAMSEYLLLLQMGMVAQVACIPSPLAYFRVHDTSWSMTTTDVLAWETAGGNFISHGLRVIRHDAYAPDYGLHLRRIFQLTLSNVRTVLLRPGAEFSPHRELRFFLQCIRCALRGSEGHRVSAVGAMLRVTMRFAGILCSDVIRESWARARGRQAVQEC